MQLINMKLPSKADDDGDSAQDIASPRKLPASERDAYPYGMRIRIDDDEFKKLPKTMQDALRSGGKFKLVANALRTDYGEKPMQDGSTHCCVELTMTDIGVEADDSEAKEREKYEHTGRSSSKRRRRSVSPSHARRAKKSQRLSRAFIARICCSSWTRPRASTT